MEGKRSGPAGTEHSRRQSAEMSGWLRTYFCAEKADILQAASHNSNYHLAVLSQPMFI